jgi:hypothetical protein
MIDQRGKHTMAAPKTLLAVFQTVKPVSLPVGAPVPVKIIGLNVIQVDGSPALHLCLNKDNTLSYQPEINLIGF